MTATLVGAFDPPKPVNLTTNDPATVRIVGGSSFGDNTFGYGPFGGVDETVPYGMFDPPTPEMAA
jgi:hypothetical protein